MKLRSYLSVIFLLLAAGLTISAQTGTAEPPINETKPPPILPKTPTEAYNLALEPVNEWMKSKEPTLESNLKALKEKEARAVQYVKLFKISDWKEMELFNLAELYLTVNQLAEAEKALTVYLKSAPGDKTTKARTMLLSALVAQKKLDKARPVAVELLNEPKYNQDIIIGVQDLIDELSRTDISKAIALSEKRLPNLIKYSEANIKNPNHAAKMLDFAVDLNLLYVITGNSAKSQKFLDSLLGEFNASPLSADKRIKQSFDAAILRQKLIGTMARPIEGIEYIDMPKTPFAELHGKVILLDFLAHWCAPCIASFPETNALRQKYESKGLVIIGVTSYYGFFGAEENVKAPDELALLKNLKSKRHADFGFVVGPRSNEQLYGVAGLPAVALIDRAGKIRYIKQGAQYKKEIESIIQRLIEEKVKN